MDDNGLYRTIGAAFIRSDHGHWAYEHVFLYFHFPDNLRGRVNKRVRVNIRIVTGNIGSDVVVYICHGVSPSVTL
jgi:hypothetical protein